MKQKIEWYKEVLELEPGSRVFFPLAKLLAADGQSADAVRFLQQGLLRHPDHVEARLLLVELLFLHNAETELAQEIEKLGTLFASYPGFWKAWSERMAETPAMRDASLAMRFFAAALQGKKVGWGEIIEQGIQSLLGSGPESFSPAFAAPSPSAQEESAMRGKAPARAVASLPEIPELPEEEDAPQATAPPLEPLTPLRTVIPAALASGGFADEPPRARVDEDANPAEDDEPEEGFSLRTRSMAEVLAEQGDLHGALEIYHELMQSAAPDEKASLMARADELSHRLSTGPSPESPRVEEKIKTPGAESTRLVSLLESLAQRLEARAR